MYKSIHGFDAVEHETWMGRSGTQMEGGWNVDGAWGNKDGRQMAPRIPLPLLPFDVAKIISKHGHKTIDKSRTVQTEWYGQCVMQTLLCTKTMSQHHFI